MSRSGSVLPPFPADVVKMGQGAPGSGRGVSSHGDKAYQRRQESVNQHIRELSLAGVSTRRVGEVLAPMLGQAPSPQTVSRVARSPDAEVKRFHERPLPDSYWYLLVDGIVLKMKTATGLKSGRSFLPTGSLLRAIGISYPFARPRRKARHSGKLS